MTRTSAMMGSPLYMSPEQMTSVRDVDARSDIWALGVILFELLTGTTPFVGDTLPQVCGLVIQSPDPPASSRRPELPPALDAVIHRCLAKNPGDRFQSVAELAQALEGFAGRYGLASVERIFMLSGDHERASRAPVVEAAVPAATARIAGTHAAWGETKPTVPRGANKAWLVIPLLAVPLVAAAGWWFVVKPRADVPSPETSASVVSAAEPVSITPPALPAASVAEPVLASPPTPAPSPVSAQASAARPPAAPPRAAAVRRPVTNVPASPTPKATGASNNKPQDPVASKPAASAAEAKRPSMGGRL